jgi:hypothetical protein
MGWGVGHPHTEALETTGSALEVELLIVCTVAQNTQFPPDDEEPRLLVMPLQGPGYAFPGNGKQRWSAGRVAELERKVGQQALEIDFLKECLQHIGEQRMLHAMTGNPRFSGSSKKK